MSRLGPPSTRRDPIRAVTELRVLMSPSVALAEVDSLKRSGKLENVSKKRAARKHNFSWDGAKDQLRRNEALCPGG